MSSPIFINIPVFSPPLSIAFYQSIGFTKNDRFSSDSITCMTNSPSISVMLHTHARFTDFLPAGRKIADAKAATEVVLCLSADTRKGVDELVEKAVKGGGKADVGWKEDIGWMYGRSFDDLDGHVWEVVWMDEEGFEKMKKDGSKEAEGGKTEVNNA